MRRRVWVEKVKGDGDFMDVMIPTINGAQIYGFDVDTICKFTTLVSSTIYLNTCDDKILMTS